MIKKLFFALIMCLSSFFCNADGSKEKAGWLESCKSIENVIDDVARSKNYNAAVVKKVFQKNIENPNCDDGAYSEGMSDVVVQSLARDFSNALQTMTGNKNLENFVMKHIDATADWKDLDQIADHTQKNCPAKQTNLCKAIYIASQNASKEAKGLKK